MAKEKWADKSSADTNWTHVASLAGLIMTSKKPDPFDPVGPVYGLNPYEGAIRLVGGVRTDDELWMDGIQGYQPATVGDLLWKHDGTDYAITRCARIPYLIKPIIGPTRRQYLDHVLVGYHNTNYNLVGGSTTYPWANKGGVKGNNGELGSFIVDDLWGQSGVLRAIQNWWSASAKGQDPPVDYGHWIRKYKTTDPDGWRFREVTRDVYGSVRICIADDRRHLWYLLVGYEGGGGW